MRPKSKTQDGANIATKVSAMGQKAGDTIKRTGQCRHMNQTGRMVAGIGDAPARSKAVWAGPHGAASDAASPSWLTEDAARMHNGGVLAGKLADLLISTRANASPRPKPSAAESRVLQRASPASTPAASRRAQVCALTGTPSHATSEIAEGSHLRHHNPRPTILARLEAPSLSDGADAYSNEFQRGFSSMLTFIT